MDRSQSFIIGVSPLVKGVVDLRGDWSGAQGEEDPYSGSVGAVVGST